MFADRPDSANKKLNLLLDKEPRWLHPRNERDMARRLEQLSNSKPRLHAVTQPNSSRSSGAYESVSPHNSLMSPAMNIKIEPSASPFTTAASPFYADLATTSPNPGFFHPHDSLDDAQPYPLEDDNDIFSTFLRRPTFASTTSAVSTGSLHRVLSDYSESYIRAVGKLVRKFTIPTSDRPTPSPGSDGLLTANGWSENEEPLTPTQCYPYPLPGDFLNLHMSNGQCDVLSTNHAERRCLCYVRAEVVQSPWVTIQGLTADGHRVLSGAFIPSDIFARDVFGNTILHFLAATQSIDVLLQVVELGFASSILHIANNAGQTLLHVINPAWLHNFAHFCRLVDDLASISTFDIYATDFYGRNFLHMLHLAGASPAQIDHFLQCGDARLGSQRDAFGVKPVHFSLASDSRSPEPAADMELDLALEPPRPSSSSEAKSDADVAREVQLITNARLARETPSLEDQYGRNGLHCLAMATLSRQGVVDRYNLGPSTPPPRRSGSPSQGSAKAKPDSSKERLKLRHDLVAGLLDAGVNPNAYDKNGNTPLMVFAAQLPEDDDYKLGPQILKLLVQRGANVHARNRAGETALHVAVRCGRKLAMRTLVDKGANVDARDGRGRGVLDVADAMLLASGDELREYAHYEACRAWLSGKGNAVQDPGAVAEWSRGNC